MADDLENRLQQLELEQETQNTELYKLNDFDKEIRKLESVLAQIETYEVEQSKEEDFERDLTETEKLERELARIDQEYEDDLKRKTKAVNNQKNYIICLMNNPKSPKEWSGKNWVSRGDGTTYNNPEYVKQIFQQLKKQWPNYSLKIFKR